MDGFKEAMRKREKSVGYVEIKGRLKRGKSKKLQSDSGDEKVRENRQGKKVEERRCFSPLKSHSIALAI